MLFIYYEICIIKFTQITYNYLKLLIFAVVYIPWANSFLFLIQQLHNVCKPNYGPWLMALS